MLILSQIIYGVQDPLWLPTGPDVSIDEVITTLHPFGEKAVIVKDYVKSRKHEWLDACYIPSAADREAVERVVRRFLQLQGEDLNMGLVFREFVEFEPLTTHSRSGMPLTREYRLFVLLTLSAKSKNRALITPISTLLSISLLRLGVRSTMRRKTGDVMICPHCSADNIDSANYCNRCGFQLRLNLCSECGNSNDESAKFCNHCGFEFENEDDANAGDAGGERAENQLISGQPGKSPKKAMNGYLIAGMVLLAIILSAGAPIFMGVQSWMETQAPIKVMQTYCNDLINNDAQGAYQQLTLKIQQQLSESTFAAGIETGLYPKDGGLKKCDIPKLVVNQHKRAVAFLDLTKGNGTVEPTIVDLVLENGIWKIEHPYGLGTDLS